MPSSMTNDVETLKMLEFVPTLPQEKKATLSERQPSLREQLHSALKDSNLNCEEFKNEAEDNRGSELENSGSERHYPKERVSLAKKCCYDACTKKDIVQLC